MAGIQKVPINSEQVAKILDDNFEYLEGASKTSSGVGDPLANGIIPASIGQTYIDLLTGEYWISTGLSKYNWNSAHLSQSSVGFVKNSTVEYTENADATIKQWVMKYPQGRGFVPGGRDISMFSLDDYNGTWYLSVVCTINEKTQNKSAGDEFVVEWLGEKLIIPFGSSDASGNEWYTAFDPDIPQAWKDEFQNSIGKQTSVSFYASLGRKFIIENAVFLYDFADPATMEFIGDKVYSIFDLASGHIAKDVEEIADIVYSSIEGCVEFKADGVNKARLLIQNGKLTYSGKPMTVFCKFARSESGATGKYFNNVDGQPTLGTDIRFQDGTTNTSYVQVEAGSPFGTKATSSRNRLPAPNEWTIDGHFFGGFNFAGGDDTYILEDNEDSTNTTTEVVIGSNPNPGFDFNYGIGETPKIKAIIYFDRVLTAGEKTQVYDYLNNL